MCQRIKELGLELGRMRLMDGRALLRGARTYISLRRRDGKLCGFEEIVKGIEWFVKKGLLICLGMRHNVFGIK